MIGKATTGEGLFMYEITNRFLRTQFLKQMNSVDMKCKVWNHGDPSIDDVRWVFQRLCANEIKEFGIDLDHSDYKFSIRGKDRVYIIRTLNL